MAGSCCSTDETDALRGQYGRILWIVLALNALMFLVEGAASLRAESVSLAADALDFFGDSVNYAASLFLLSAAAMARSWLALAKGALMGVFGLGVLGAAVFNAVNGSAPEPATMGVVGAMALTANAAVFGLLWRFRGGDSDMEAVWLCSRNDVIANCAVLVAALGVFGARTAWPDLIVGSIVATVSLQASIQVVRRAVSELNSSRSPVEEVSPKCSQGF